MKEAILHNAMQLIKDRENIEKALAKDPVFIKYESWAARMSRDLSDGANLLASLESTADVATILVRANLTKALQDVNEQLLALGIEP